jgi:hypothetical protein
MPHHVDVHSRDQCQLVMLTRRGFGSVKADDGPGNARAPIRPIHGHPGGDVHASGSRFGYRHEALNDT